MNYIVFDLDGVITRKLTKHLPDIRAQQELLRVVGRAKSKCKILVLTNRPPGQMHQFAYNFALSQGFWITESGASVFDVSTEGAYVNKSFVEYIPYVKKLRKILRIELGVADFPRNGTKDIQFEPGMGLIKTNLILPDSIREIVSIVPMVSASVRAPRCVAVNRC